MLNFHSNFLYVHVKCYCLFLDEVFTVLFLWCTAQRRHHEDGIQELAEARKRVRSTVTATVPVPVSSNLQ